jgi:hypothetical protein
MKWRRIGRSHRGGGGMAVVRNTSETMAARLPVWMRCMLSWLWVEESAVPLLTPFEAEVGEAGERWGSRVRHRVE